MREIVARGECRPAVRAKQIEIVIELERKDRPLSIRGEDLCVGVAAIGPDRIIGERKQREDRITGGEGRPDDRRSILNANTGRAAGIRCQATAHLILRHPDCEFKRRRHWNPESARARTEKSALGNCGHREMRLLLCPHILALERNEEERFGLAGMTERAEVFLRERYADGKPALNPPEWVFSFRRVW